MFKEVGGVRCGRKAKKYHPKWKPEASLTTGKRKMFKLGEESDEEEDVFEVKILDLPSYMSL